MAIFNHVMSFINPSTGLREAYGFNGSVESLLSAYEEFWKGLGYSDLYVDDKQYTDDMIFHDLQLFHCKSFMREDGYTHCEDCGRFYSCLKFCGGTFEYCADFEGR